MAKKRNTVGKLIRAQEKKRKSDNKRQKRMLRQESRIATENIGTQETLSS
jgi:hypothetical protein